MVVWVAIAALLYFDNKYSEAITEKLWALGNFLYLDHSYPLLLRIFIISFITAIGFFLALLYTRQYALRILLSYRGWMCKYLFGFFTHKYCIAGSPTTIITTALVTHEKNNIPVTSLTQRQHSQGGLRGCSAPHFFPNVMLKQLYTFYSTCCEISHRSMQNAAFLSHPLHLKFCSTNPVTKRNPTTL